YIVSTRRSFDLQGREVLTCSNCQSESSRSYLTVFPRAFATDMNISKSAQGSGERKGISGSTDIWSPMLESTNYQECGNSLVDIGRQRSEEHTSELQSR